MNSQLKEKDKTIRLQKEFLQYAINNDPSIKVALREMYKAFYQ